MECGGLKGCSHHKIVSNGEDLYVIAYRAMVDIPRELVRHLARLLAAERRTRGTRHGTRALTCFYQALLILVWFRKAEDVTLLGAGFGISRATADRYWAYARAWLYDRLRTGDGTSE